MLAFSWNLLSAVVLQGSVLVSNAVVARALGLQEFGIYAVLVSTVMTVAGLAQGGVGLIGTKFVGELLTSDPQRVGRILRMCSQLTAFTGVAMSVCLLALAPVVAGTVLGKPQVEPFVRWVAVAVVFQVSAAYQYGALQGFGAFKAISRVGVVAGTLHVVLSAAGVWLGGITGALAAFVISSAMRWLLFGAALRQTRRDHAIPVVRAVTMQDWRLIWTFALPASLASFITMPCLWGVTVLVARQPEGLAWAGLFAVGHQIRLTALQLPSLLNAVSFSVLSRLKGGGEGAAFRQVFWSGLTIGALFVSLVALLLGALATPVLGIFGPGFVGARELLIVLLASTLPETMATSAYQLVQSKGRMWRSLLLIALPRDLGYLVLANVLIAAYSLVGVGIAYFAAQVVSLLSTMALGRGGLHPSLPERDARNP